MFRRLRRFERTPLRDAREDRLTEALAATLIAAPDAARFLISDLFGMQGTPATLAAGTETEVKTQVYVKNVGRIDLELRLRRPSAADLVVWVEAKVDSEPYREQGQRYLNELKNCGGTGCFSWLIKVDQQVLDPPPNAQQHSWQDLADSLRRWLDERPGDQENREVWLVTQFLSHLEREEGLAFIISFTSEDASVLERYDEAEGRLIALRDEAKRLVEENWGKSKSEWIKSRDFWFQFPRSRSRDPSPWPAGFWFEWHGREVRSQGGRWLIGAGVTIPKGLMPSAESHEDSLRALTDRGYVVNHEGDYYYLFQYLSLQEIAELASDKKSQQEALGKWIVGAFDVLNEQEALNLGNGQR